MFRILLIFAFIYVSGIHAQISPDRVLFIVIDDSEKENIWGAASSEFAALVDQKVGPIVASASLVRNVLIKEGSQKDSTVLRGFHEKEWVIKKINDHLLLFLPVSLADTLKTDLASLKADTKEEKYSPTELQLGLKINHMPTISLSDVAGLKTGDPFDDYFLDAFSKNYEISAGDDKSHRIVKRLGKSSIFVFNREYRKEENLGFAPPRWTIHMAGHGDKAEKIAGLPIKIFRDILKLIERGLSINSLILVSCYSGGETIEKVFSLSSRKIGQETFSYPIIMQALTDAPVSHLFRIEEESSNKKQIFDTPHNYKEFYRLATSPESARNFLKIVEPIFPTVPNITFYGFHNTKYWGNAPQIRPIGMPTFTPLAGRNKVAIIDMIMANYRLEERPLDINRFFGGFPSLLLIKTSNVNFEIHIDKSINKNFESIVSMLGDDSIHRFKKIRVTWAAGDPRTQMQKNSQALRWFMKVDRLKANKLFYVKDFGPMKDVVISLRYTPALTGFSSREAIFTEEAYFKDLTTGKLFVLPDDKAMSVKEAGENEKAKYQSLLKKALGQVQYYETVKIGALPRGYFMRPRCESSCIINNTSSKLSVSDQFRAISSALYGLSDSSYILVKNLKGKNGYAISPSIKKADEEIALKDVLFTKEKYNPYYTLDSVQYLDNEVVDFDYLTLVSANGDKKDSEFKKELEKLIAKKLKTLEPKISEQKSPFICKTLPRPKMNPMTPALEEKISRYLKEKNEEKIIDVIESNNLPPYLKVNSSLLTWHAENSGAIKLKKFLNERINNYEKEFPNIEKKEIRDELKDALENKDSNEAISIIKKYDLSVDSRLSNAYEPYRPLIAISALRGMKVLLEFLLENGAKLDFSPQPLLEKILMDTNNYEIASLLMAAQAPLRSEEISLRSLMLRFYSGSLDLLKCLVTNGVKVGLAFESAISLARPEIVKYLYQVLKESYKDFKVSSYWHLQDALPQLITGGDKKSAIETFNFLRTRLLEQGSKIDGDTLDVLFMQATEFYVDQIPLLTELIKLGADVNQGKYDNDTPVRNILTANRVTNFQKESALRLLISHGAKIKRSYIEYAESKGMKYISELLKQNIK